MHQDDFRPIGAANRRDRVLQSCFTPPSESNSREESTTKGTKGTKRGTRIVEDEPAGESADVFHHDRLSFVPLVPFVVLFPLSLSRRVECRTCC